MPIELYTWNTPNGRKISVALEEMGLPYNVHPVNISKNEQFNPDFLKISPNNRIPAIVDPDGPGGSPISIFESGAILIYLGVKTGKFYPADMRAQVPVLEWLMWQMGGFGPMPGQVHHFLQVENEQDRRYGLDRYMKETRRLYGVLMPIKGPRSPQGSAKPRDMSPRPGSRYDHPASAPSRRKRSIKASYRGPSGSCSAAPEPVFLPRATHEIESEEHGLRCFTDC